MNGYSQWIQSKTIAYTCYHTLFDYANSDFHPYSRRSDSLSLMGGS